ncbi:1578_t:CDS:2 [Cetraspora pellucida]|uniref:1578_t:CDS:1 n=1 Tax=Cetraspora pellucida TaxID=1433469 RepID=A0ACA9LL44_9GLOM|nr:1578_t:CDS:2 [Cetraspora pellucida]
MAKIQDISDEKSQTEINLLESQLNFLKETLNREQQILFNQFIILRKNYTKNSDNKKLEEELIILEEAMEEAELSEETIDEIKNLCDQIVKLEDKIDSYNYQAFKYGDFEGSLIIKDQLSLKSISISDAKSIRELTLSNLANLEDCKIYHCGLEKLIIRNCPHLKSLVIRNNSLTNLNFVKDLTNLQTLKIDGNERISVGVEHLPNNLETFSCEGTELFEALEPYQENNKRQLSSLREENKKLDKKYKVLKKSVGELKNYIEEKLTLLSNKVSLNDPDTKEIISDLRKGIKGMADENKELKDKIEYLSPLFNDREPILEPFANISNETERTKIEKELRLLKNLRSSYVIQYYGEYQKDNDIYIIIEYAEHGSLAKFIERNKNEENY